MLGPGPLIAIDVFFLYTILGPLVLFAIYALIDSLDKLNQDRFNRIDRNRIVGAGTIQGIKKSKKNPALLSDEDVEGFII
ncbi:MAG: hypothetical protein J7K30_07265 [Deltaproteobacteria bacterium]|nr:hypothetical protein [Deltaproteobacteria bacterium]